MNTILSSLIAALSDLRTPRVLAVMLVPPLAALLVWGILAWAFSDVWARWVADWIATSPWLAWVGKLGLSSAFIWGSGIMAFVVLLPIMLVTAVVVAQMVVMPIVVPWIAERRFPQLEQRKGGTIVGSVVNAVTAVVIFAALWVLTLPLWFTGIGALVLPLVLSAYLNQRLFRYDALAEHATAQEYRVLTRTARGRLFLLGLVLALFYYLPLVNLAVPVLSALAFTHLSLGELARLRQAHA